MSGPDVPIYRLAKMLAVGAVESIELTDAYEVADFHDLGLTDAEIEEAWDMAITAAVSV